MHAEVAQAYPHDQPPDDRHVHPGVVLPGRLRVVTHDDVKASVVRLYAPVVYLAFEQRQRLDVRHVTYVDHALDPVVGFLKPPHFKNVIIKIHIQRNSRIKNEIEKSNSLSISIQMTER